MIVANYVTVQNILNILWLQQSYNHNKHRFLSSYMIFTNLYKISTKFINQCLWVAQLNSDNYGWCVYAMAMIMMTVSHLIAYTVKQTL